LGYPFRFVELAEEINRSMPNYVYSRIQSLLNDSKIAVNGSRILLLGVTYKPNISDQRESPAEPLANVLIGNGALVDFYDPFVAEWRLSGDTIIHRVKDLYLAAESSDIVVLLQQHSSFDLERLVDIANLFLDTKGATKSSHAFRL
jgi:UDP-N-acetyl-D-glucosamine dehydrogenase